MVKKRLLFKCIQTSRNLIDLPVGPKKHFSFVVDKNRILSFGVNNGFKTHPMAKYFGYRYSCIHSELEAILNFEGKNIENYSLLNIRIGKDKFSIRNSKPCDNCQKLIKDFNIKRVYFFENGIRSEERR